MPLDHPNLSETPPAGKTLRQQVAASGTLPEASLLRLGLDLSRALCHLHAAGRLEAGLSVDSVVMAEGGRTVLVTGSPAPPADEGWVPFERQSQRPQAASDLYQLGAVLLFAATGKPPSSFGLPQALSRGLFSEVPAKLRPTLERLVEPVWDKRPKTALELADELDCLAQGKATPRQRFRRKAAVGALLAVLTLGAGLRFFRPAHPPVQAVAVLPAPSKPLSRPAEAPHSLWSPVRALSSEVMALRPASDGGVWAFTKSGAALFRKGSLTAPRTTLDNILTVSKSDHPTKEGPEPRAASYATGVGVGDEAFMGGWDGDVFRGSLEGGDRQWPPPLGERGRVDDMAWRDGTLLAAWHGRVWTWSEGDKAWGQSLGNAARNVKALLVTPGGEVYSGGGDGLWRWGPGGWKKLWKGDGPNDGVVALALDSQNRILVGTGDGFLTVTLSGAPSARELVGHRVTSFAEGAEGRLWVGTWDAGIFLRAEDRWVPFGFAYGLPSDTVSGLVVDGYRILWVGMYGAGAVAAPEAAIAGAALSAQAPARLPGDAYSSIEDAARRNMVEGQPEGGVTRLVVSGKDFVYFQGRQVAPRGPGCLSADGTSARYEGASWVLRRKDGAETVLPPMPGRYGGVTGGLLDAKGRLWAGTRSGGVYLYDSGAWKVYGAEAGLDENLVTDLAEDREGNVWVGTSPSFDKAAGRYLRKNLHRFDGKAWTAYSPDDGLGYWSTAALRPLPDGSMAAATNGGLSVVSPTGIRTSGRADGLDSPSANWVAADRSGLMLLTHYDEGLTLVDDGRFTHVTSRQGLFSDRLRAAAFGADGQVWLTAEDGSAFITTAKALKDAGR